MISIIILNYNTFSLTSQCIRSIYAQTQSVEFEVVLVDNASTECNPDMFLEEFSQITLVKNIENRGFSRGCNDGILKAKGDFILLLNSDTVLLNDAISIVHDFLVKNASVGVATCRLENKDTTPQNNCQRFPSKKLALYERLRWHKLFSKQKRGKIWFGPYFNYSEIAFPDWVWGTFFMFPKNLLQHFPGNKLTETFWMYIEDMEWCWIARKAGYKVAFIPDGRVLHYGGGTNHSNQVSVLIKKNHEQFIKLYY